MPRLPLHLLRLVRPLPTQCFRFTTSTLCHRPRTLFIYISLPQLHPFPRQISPSRGFKCPLFAPAMLQVRHKARGNEYQPSQRVRKRRHGFLARKRSVGGRKILARRKAKQRRFLTH